MVGYADLKTRVVFSNFGSRRVRPDVKKHPSNPFENELIHEGVNECFEVEERQLEGHSGASIYDLFNQRLETSCNEAFNAVISKKGFGAEFLGSMLKE